MNKAWLKKLMASIRLISLAMLFAGAASIVFAAITLVKAAVAQGIPVNVAATTNAPMFIQFGKIALGAGFALLIAEAFDFANNKTRTTGTLIRYISSFAAIGSAMIFGFGLVPAMDQLQPLLKTSADAYKTFHELHEVSRFVFGGMILFALISLITPVWAKSVASE